MTLADPKPGGWSVGEILSSASLDTIRDGILAAVDGVGGGLYTLDVADLEFTGSKSFILDVDAEFTFGHTLDVGGAIDLSSSGRINLASGAVIGLNGTSSLIVGSTALIELDSGANLNATSGSVVSIGNGAQLNVSNGGIVDMANNSTLELHSGAFVAGDSGCSVSFARSQDLKIASETCFWRSPMIPAWITLYSNAGVVTPAWAINSESSSGGWDLNDVAAANMFRTPLNRLPGDVVTSISMSLNGGAGAGHAGNISGMTMPKIQLVKISSIGVKTIVASAPDPTTVAATYDAAHSVTLDNTTDTVGGMPVTITGDTFFLEVIGEHGTNSVASTLRLGSIFGQSTSKQFRSSIEFA